MCVVDELAHTNVPGSRHAKRYEDVLEILDAGIHVMTAVNIQHLETLNDAVARATGVRVRETVPDTFLDRADEVINVDVTVEELRNRLREGKIYRPEKVEQALTNFFRKGNLSTLRELALRAVADEVGEKAASYRAREGLEPALIPGARDGVHELERAGAAGASAPARASPAGSGRSGTRCTSRRRARQPDRINPRDAEALQQNIRLAESLGATVVRVKADRPSDGLDRVRAARRRHARHLRPERAVALGAAVARLDARPVPRAPFPMRPCRSCRSTRCNARDFPSHHDHCRLDGRRMLLGAATGCVKAPESALERLTEARRLVCRRPRSIDQGRRRLEPGRDGRHR